MVAIRRSSFAVALALGLAACATAPAPTPIAIPGPGAATASAPPTPGATPVATAAPTVRPASGFFFHPAEIVDYYEHGVGFACEEWAEAAAPGHQVRACRLADADNPPADQAITLTIDGRGALADVLAGYVHRDGTAVDRDAALRFFATVVGASFGGDDGQVAVTWLSGNLGAPSATVDVRGLRFGTFLSDLPEARGSALFIEIATPAFTAAAG